MLHDGALEGSDVQLKSNLPTDLVQQAQYLPLQLASDQERTKQLVSDIREALENPAFDEAIQEALAKAAVPERLLQQEGNNLAGSQHPQAGWGPGSPRSTITFTKIGTDAAADKPQVASAAGDSAVKSGGNSGEGANEIRHQVESLLQRTDSILSRSSGRSSLRRSVSNLHSLNATSANPSPHAPTPLRPAGGFDFDSALPPLETPTMKSTTGSGPRDAANTTLSGGLSLTGNRRRTAANPFTASRRPGAQNEYNNNGPVAVGLASQEADTLPMGNGNGTFDGLLPLSGDGVGDLTDARRLSQQALSEIGDRFDSHANVDRQNRGFESGSSGDRTTVVLDRSASWKIKAAQSGGPYTNFAPLGQLADAVTESVAAAMQGALATAAASAAAAAAGIGARDRSSSSDNANGRTSGGGVQLPKQQVSNKIALANMLLPEYVESAALAKLKAELASLSNPGPRSHVEGSQFDAVLMALTARLSQWPQLERKSEEMFRKMLNALLDKIFLRLLPSKGGLMQLPAADDAADGGQSNDSSLSGAVGGVGAGLIGVAAAGTSSSGVGGGGTAAGGAAGNAPDMLRRSYSRGPATAAGAAADSSGRRASDQSRPSTAPQDNAADAGDAAPQPKPSDSMLKAAFAKLAFGQAMLRGGGPMMPVKPALAASAATATTSKGASAPADGTDADTVAGTPDVGMSPALSRTSSIATSVSTAAAQPAVASRSAAGAAPKSQQRVQWSPAVATAPTAAAPAVEASFSLAPAGPRGTQVLQLQHQAQPTPAANTLRRQPSNRGNYGSPGVPPGQAATVPGQDVQHPKDSTPEKQQRPHPAGSPVESAWLINLPLPWRQPPQQQRVEVTPVPTPPPPPAAELQPRQKSPGWLDGLSGRFSPNAALQSAPGSGSPALARLQSAQRRQQQQYYEAAVQPPLQQQQQLPQPGDAYRLSVATPFGVSQEQMQGPGPSQTYWGSPGVERCIGRSIAGSDTISSPGVANLVPGGASSTTRSWVVPSPALFPQPLAQPLLVQMHQQALLPAPQQQQQQQKRSPLQQQQLARVLTVDSASNSSGSRAATATPPLLQPQQGFTGNPSPGVTGPSYHGGANRSPVARISQALAAMQHRYDQQGSVRASLFQQAPAPQQQLQQQQQLVHEQVQPQQQQHSTGQSWLAPDGSLSNETSPVRTRQHHSTCSTPVGSYGGMDCTYPTGSPGQAVGQPQYQHNSPIQQHNNPLYVGTATVHVSSPGAAPGSPLKQRVAMPGGCINVYSDAVEVHSSSPLEIKVSPGPAMLSGVGMM